MTIVHICSCHAMSIDLAHVSCAYLLCQLVYLLRSAAISAIHPAFIRPKCWACLLEFSCQLVAWRGSQRVVGTVQHVSIRSMAAYVVHSAVTGFVFDSLPRNVVMQPAGRTVAWVAVKHSIEEDAALRLQDRYEHSSGCCST